jgi:hypothetical protein
VQNFAEVLEAETLFCRVIRDPDPGDIALSDMLDAGGAVDKIVDLALQDRFEILLHLAPGDFRTTMPISMLPCWRDIFAKSGPTTSTLPSTTSSNEAMCRYSKQRESLATELHPHVAFADDFAFERRAVRHRHGDVGDFHLYAAHFDAFLDQAFRLFQVVLAFDLVERQADDMFVGGYAGWQDLRDDRICDHGEAEIDRSRRSRVLQVVHFTKRQDERQTPGSCCRAGSRAP